MNILNAALQPSLLEAALSYRMAGLSVVPVNGKRAAVPWKQWTHEKPSHAQITAWARGGKLAGVAVICGAVSGNLVVLDLDGWGAIMDFRLTFPALNSTYAVRTGSGRGEHHYFFVDEPTKTAIAPGRELRSDGAYVVAPPSVHPQTSLQYQPLNTSPVMKLWDMREVTEWIVSRRPPPSVAPVVPQSPAPPSVPYRAPLSPAPVDKRLRAYARAGVARQLDRLRSTRSNVNDQLNLTAYVVGRMLGEPRYGLNEVEVRLQIEAAAAHLSRRDGIEATRRTIESGLRAGMTNPQPLPDFAR